MALNETNGVQYIDPLEKKQTRGIQHYEHIYYGKILQRLIFVMKKGI
jgi:hypothetical protein